MSLIKRILGQFTQHLAAELQRRICAEFERGVVLPQPEFRNKIVLPLEYGCAMPERAVEILLARLSYRSGITLLDVGYANAMECRLHMIRRLPKPRHLIGLDIAMPTYNATRYYKLTIQADTREVPLAHSVCDLIWCVSVIEHFGMDNSGYSCDSRRDEDADIRAVQEMMRLTCNGGTILITVPYGKYEDHGWFRQYDRRRWKRLLNMVQPAAEVSELYFQHTESSGWRSVLPQELEGVGYYDQRNSGAAGLAAAFIEKRGKVLARFHDRTTS